MSVENHNSTPHTVEAYRKAAVQLIEINGVKIFTPDSEASNIQENMDNSSASVEPNVNDYIKAEIEHLQFDILVIERELEQNLISQQEADYLISGIKAKIEFLLSPAADDNITQEAAEARTQALKNQKEDIQKGLRAA